MRYIELNPVRANMIQQPSEYQWSSFRCNALGYTNQLLTSHPLYQALGLNKDERKRAYQSLFEAEIENKDLNLIRNAATFSMPTGDNRFKEQVEKMVNRKLGYAKKGRPYKVSIDERN